MKLAALALAFVGMLGGGPQATDSRPLAKRVFVNGDSLAVGTQPYLPGLLRGWSVRQSVAISRHAPEGPAILAALGRGLPRVVVMSLGTNDDPRHVSAFRAAIRSTMNVVGRRRCVVWINIVRPPVAGASYAGYNRALAQESRPRENLRVVNWVKMVSENPGWIGGDGVHPNGTGYQARARAIARSVKRCR